MKIARGHQALILVGIIYAIVAFVYFPKWTVDDAYITYRYADNFANHGQLTWNIGEKPDPEEGYTGIALPFVLGIFIKLGFSPVSVSPIIGITSYFTAGFLIYLILKKFKIEPLAHGVALLFYATLPFLFTNALSGLETMFFMALVTASLLALINCFQPESTSSAKEIFLGIVLLMTSLTRPEGVALSLGCLGALIYVKYIKNEKKQFPWRYLLIFALTYALPALIYFIWRVNYYEQLLPNTFYVKTHGGFRINHLKDLAHFFILFFTAPALGTLLILSIDPDQAFKSLSEKNLSKPFKALLISSLIFAGLIITQFVRSKLSMNFSYRFFVPFLPSLILTLFILFGISLPLLKSVRLTSPLKFKLILSALIILSIYQMLIVTHHLKDETKYINSTNVTLNNLHIPAAQLIKKTVPTNEWLMVLYDAGAVPYYTGLKTIDLGGLNDKKIARKLVSTPEQFRDYFFSYNPGVAVFTSYEPDRIKHDSKADSLTADPRFANFILLKQFAPHPTATNQNYFLDVFIRKDLLPTEIPIK